MLTNQGQIATLTHDLAFLSTLQWGLFVNDVEIINSTIFEDLVEASWSGYSRFNVPAWYPPVAVGPTARTVAVDDGYIPNDEDVAVTYRGWFVYNPALGQLHGGQTMPEQTIGAHASARLHPTAIIY